MVFLGVYRALYDYSPAAENELELKEDDLLFVLEKDSEDDWWKAKKKAAGEDEEEPEGLIPNNYVEEVRSSDTFSRRSSHLVANGYHSTKKHFADIHTHLGNAHWPSESLVRL